MDSLTYSYYTSTNAYYNGQQINRLQEVEDKAGATAYPLDFEGTSEYFYDNIGNLITDTRDSIKEIVWTTYGKVSKVERESGCKKPDLEFLYDPLGNRLCKIVKPRPAGIPTNQNEWTFTWYLRDTQGNIMGVYTETHDEDDAYLSTNEFPMYGSARLGVQNASDTLSHITYTQSTFDADGFYTSSYENVPLNETDTNSYHYYPLQKQYELTNHLGNVLATISARPRLIFDNQTFQYKEADVISVSDYFGFGMLMPGRQWNSGSYRHGFNGFERDDEMKGAGNWYSFGDYGYDSRIVQRPSVDPLASEAPGWSPYRAFYCNPIYWTDPTGMLEDGFTVDKLGNIERVDDTGGEEFDVLYNKEKYDAGKKSYNNTGSGDNGIKMDKNILSNVRHQEETYKDYYEDGSDVTVVQDYMVMKNDDKAANLFKFMAKNTTVEWDHMKIGNEKGLNGLNVLITTHDDSWVGSSNIRTFLLNKGWEYRGVDHNHPSGNFKPSGWSGDLGVGESILKTSPNCIFRIYTSQDAKYHTYTIPKR